MSRVVLSLSVGLLLVVSGTATAGSFVGTTLEREWLRELSPSHSARVAQSPTAVALAIFVGPAFGGGRTAMPQSPSALLVNGDKSIAVRWTDPETLADGGRLIFHATKIRLRSDVFAVTASVTNGSTHRIGIQAATPNTPAGGAVAPFSFGLAYREPPNPNITTRRLINVRALTFAPQLPQFLDPGQTWKGTFSGRSPKIREHHTWWIVYGLFDPGGYWVSDKSFST